MNRKNCLVSDSCSTLEIRQFINDQLPFTSETPHICKVFCNGVDVTFPVYELLCAHLTEILTEEDNYPEYLLGYICMPEAESWGLEDMVDVLEDIFNYVSYRPYTPPAIAPPSIPGSDSWWARLLSKFS